MLLVALSWTALVLSVLGLVLNAKKQIACWPIWCLSSVAWILYAMGSVPEQKVLALTNFVFLAFNINGWVAWHNDAKQKRSWLHLKKQDRAIDPKRFDAYMNGSFDVAKEYPTAVAARDKHRFGSATRSEVEQSISDRLHDPSFDLAAALIKQHPSNRKPRYDSMGNSPCTRRPPV